MKWAPSLSEKPHVDGNRLPLKEILNILKPMKSKKKMNLFSSIGKRKITKKKGTKKKRVKVGSLRLENISI